MGPKGLGPGGPHLGPGDGPHRPLWDRVTNRVTGHPDTGRKPGGSRPFWCRPDLLLDQRDVKPISRDLFTHANKDSL